MDTIRRIYHRLQEEELSLLRQLRAKRRARLTQSEYTEPRLSLGDRIADGVAATMGSWPFIITQSLILIGWMILNITAYMHHWDPYPFILLNLALSFQAAYAAPFIMMSQNRQAALDRRDARHDYDVNVKAELEIELLHQKIDHLRATEVQELINIIRRLEAELIAARAPDEG